MPSRAGRPNKNKQALIALLQAKYPGYNPVVEMATVAMEKDKDGNFINSLADRFNANKEVAKYVTPQLKAIEHTGDTGPIEIQIVKFSDANPDTK